MKPRCDKELLRLLKCYHDRVGDIGGSLHIWLDDCNIKTADLEFCIKTAESNQDWLGKQLAQYGLAMSKTQRKKTIKFWDHICYEVAINKQGSYRLS
jgi:hypothetical protein